MKKKKTRVYTNIQDEGRLHEYDIKSRKKNDDVIHKLYYSDNDIWTSLVRGKLILTVTDSADDFNLKFKFNGARDKFDLGKLEHNEAVHMYVILKHIHKLQKVHKVKFK